MMNPEVATGIHSTAIIHPSAEIGDSVAVGSYCVIGPDVKIGDGTKIEHHAVIECNTTIGRNCHIGVSAVLGGAPQDYKFHGEQSYLEIGDENIIREFCTIHRASGEGNSTVIGNNNMLMAYCHVAHNCRLANYITMANMAGISGHVQVEDKVILSGMAGVHQNVRIGKLAMVGGMSKVVQDIPPFMLADGRPIKVYDLNVIGLRRSGVVPRSRAALRQSYKLLYRSSLNITQAIERIEAEVEPCEELEYLLDFVKNMKCGRNGRQSEHRG
ncbi:MAG: acyl-ACP--UDP-N-acetylglucosamine O-acyltransferase [Armatimonadota bacterium]